MKYVRTFEQFINEKYSQVNEELYDFVKDMKSALGTGNSVGTVISYLGRKMSTDEYRELIKAGVMKGKPMRGGTNNRRNRGRW
jgi:trehalose-6-phosphate synthase